MNRRPVTDPGYLDVLKKIYVSAGDILFYSGGKAPFLRQIKRETKPEERVSYSTISKFGKMIIDLFDYIINGFHRIGLEIKKYLFKFWKVDMKSIIQECLKRISVRNTGCIMLYSQLGFEKMNKINNIFDFIYGFKPFQSKDVISNLFNSWNPVIDSFAQVRVKPSENKNKNDKCKFTLEMSQGRLTINVYKFDITLAVPMNADGWINNNLIDRNIWLTRYSNQLLVLFCSDRCDIDGMGCYAFSTVVNSGAKSSHSTHATTSMVIYGSWKDDYKSMTNVYTKTGYNKQLDALNRLPVLFSFVKYNFEQESRLATSCLLAFDSSTHGQLNSQKTKNKEELQKEWKKKNPPKSIPHTESITTEGTESVRWTARPRNTLNLGIVTPTRKSNRNNNHYQYHWKYAFNEYREFLKGYSGKPYLLVVQGFCRQASSIKTNIIEIIDNMLKRCLNSATSELPYVTDFSFNKGMYICFDVYIGCKTII